MEEHNNDDMDSLFEGMVLFTPQEVVKNDVLSHSDAVPPTTGDASTSSFSNLDSPSSEALDENLFSDLTVITPSSIETTETKTEMTSATLKTDAPAVSIFRQSSRKKKRAGLRIGYGRDSQVPDEVEPSSDSLESLGTDENPSSVSSPTTHTDSVEKGPNNQESECGNRELDFNQIDNGLIEGENISIESSTSESKESVTTQNEEKETSDNAEGKYERIKAEISEKLKNVREEASCISNEKKESTRRRRKASENVELASGRYKEIEKKLEEACENEDFDMADQLSESLAAADKEREELINALRDAEVHYDAIDSKMEEALKHQITVEEECAALLLLFSKEALADADLLLETVEVDSSKEIDAWFISAEALESKKLEIEIESQLVNDTRATLNGSIEHLVENETKEKEALCLKKKSLTHELEELLRLVKEKEIEIAENDSKIEAVEKRIDQVFSGFEDVQTGIDANFGKLQTILSESESESETLSKRKEEIDNFAILGKRRVEELRKLTVVSEDEANMYEENLRLRKAIVISVLKAREEKSRLAITEEKILADTQLLKQEISVARASLQELSSKKSNIQQEVASLRQRLLFIDKRVPELETEKKVAASTRNFKEAARIASESKSLTAEKETQESNLKESELELIKIDKEINETTIKLNEFEELVSSKEREAAMARIQRLRLISTSALNERSAALELGDVEEAIVLQAEAEIADSEAKVLQSVHNISEEEFENLSEGKQLEEMVDGGNQSS